MKRSFSATDHEHRFAPSYRRPNQPPQALESAHYPPYRPSLHPPRPAPSSPPRLASISDTARAPLPDVPRNRMRLAPQSGSMSLAAATSTTSSSSQLSTAGPSIAKGVSTCEFQIGKLYKRKTIHKEYGGNPRCGISPVKHSHVIFLFSNGFNRTPHTWQLDRHGYCDRIQDGIFYYSGESGEWTTNNKRIAEGRDQLYLFEKHNNGYYRFLGRMKFVGADERKGKCDESGNPMPVIQFRLKLDTDEQPKEALRRKVGTAFEDEEKLKAEAQAKRRKVEPMFSFKKRAASDSSTATAATTSVPLPSDRSPRPDSPLYPPSTSRRSPTPPVSRGLRLPSPSAPASAKTNDSEDKRKQLAEEINTLKEAKLQAEQELLHVESEMSLKKDAWRAEAELWGKRVEHLKQQAEKLTRAVEKKKRENEQLNAAIQQQQHVLCSDDPLLPSAATRLQPETSEHQALQQQKEALARREAELEQARAEMEQQLKAQLQAEFKRKIQVIKQAEREKYHRKLAVLHEQTSKFMAQ